MQGRSIKVGRFELDLLTEPMAIIVEKNKFILMKALKTFICENYVISLQSDIDAVVELSGKKIT